MHADSLATGAVVDALKRGRSWLAESSEVDLWFEVGGATCGETLPAGPADQVRVRLDVAGVPGGPMVALTNPVFVTVS